MTVKELLDLIKDVPEYYEVIYEQSEDDVRTDHIGSVSLNATENLVILK